jgi:hypothetical protein
VNEPKDPTVYQDIEPDAEVEDPTFIPATENIHAGDGIDSGVAPDFEPSRGAGGPDRYRYGKVPATILTVTTETTERPYVCCGYCGAQMLARTAKAGVGSDMKHEGHAIRRAAGRPHNAGSNATELRNGLRQALGVTVESVSTSGILARLRGSYAVTVSLEYSRLPEQVKVQGGSFGHTVCLFGYRKDGSTEFVGYFDPLWPQGAQGAWVRWTDIDQALWSSGHLAGTTKVPPPPSVHYAFHGTAYSRTLTVSGDNTNVRTQPKIADNVHHLLDRGAHFAAKQKAQGGAVRGSRSKTWFGDATGTRWVHSSVVTGD